jgi:predicted aminopeptidase
MPLHDNYEHAKWAERKTMAITIGLGFIAFILIVAGLAGCPRYNVWQQGLKGQAELKRAEQNRKIAIEAAKAKLESADMLGQTDEKRATYFAKAEIIRAHGVAEGLEVIGESLKDNDAYLRYRWIEGLHNGSSEVIYVPTEAGLPILEAGKR